VQGLKSPLGERAQLVGTAALRRLGIFTLGCGRKCSRKEAKKNPGAHAEALRKEKTTELTENTERAGEIASLAPKNLTGARPRSPAFCPAQSKHLSRSKAGLLAPVSSRQKCATALWSCLQCTRPLSLRASVLGEPKRSGAVWSFLRGIKHEMPRRANPLTAPGHLTKPNRSNQSNRLNG
jgi:hypothetical protein